MPINTSQDVRPIRPGAAPTLDDVKSGILPACGTQPIWHRMTEVIVKWLQFHFSLASRIEFPDLVNRVWIDDPATPIVITSLAAWNPDDSQERPCLLVDRLEQEVDVAKRNIGDHYMGLGAGPPGRYSHFMNGQHVIHCLGGREGEADLLTLEVWRELVRFAPVARRKMNLLRWFPVKVGKRMALDESKQTYTNPVVVIYGYEESWRLQALDEAEITAVRIATDVIFSGV